jgi:hypothetical protein
MTMTRFWLWTTGIFAAYVVFTLPVAGRAQQTPAVVLQFPAYKVFPGKVDLDGLPIGAARLCLNAQPTHCYLLPNGQKDAGSGIEFKFGLEPKAERISVQGGGSLILFSATFSGGGSGSLDELALLRYERDGTLRNLLPVVKLTEQGEHAIWQLPSISPMPVLVTADYVWGKGETHFAQHLFEISAYLYDLASQSYAGKIRYRTSHRYPSLDEVDQVNVLTPERAEILRQLEAK